MSFTRGTFCGLSVRGFSSSIGWNVGQHSQLSVQLVEDPANGDFAVVPGVGTPIYFQFYSYSFNGLLQKFEQKNSTDGLPVFEAVCTDPREILDGAQVIIGGYNGTVAGVANMYNAFGYWEDQGFGLSYTNEGGMPYFRIRDALLAIANTPVVTAFGGPLSFRGVSYGLDLSQLPTPPDYYRIGGTAVSILDLIAQICEDGGYDFTVDLVGLTIRVRTTSRRTQPPLGTISAIANTNWGNSVIRSSSGVELRNEITSAFLVGGDVNTLHMTDSLTQFWGFDMIGQPITGTAAQMFRPILTVNPGADPSGATSEYPPSLIAFTTPASVTAMGAFDPSYATTSNPNGKYIFPSGLYPGIGNAIGTFNYQLVSNTEVMNLNASPVSDILGTTTYQCSTIEMRMAQASMDSWSTFMRAMRPTTASGIGMTSRVRTMGIRLMQDGRQQQGLSPDTVDDDSVNVANMSAALMREIHLKENRMFEFVRGYANEYMGKKYLVGLPFVFQKVDPETLRVMNSYEVSDGGYLPEGSAPLGLSALNESVFMTQDGRFRSFVTFSNLLGADLSKVSPQGTVIEGTPSTLYQEAQVAPNIVFTPAPAALVTLSAPVCDSATNMIGDSSIVFGALHMDSGNGPGFFNANQFGSIGTKCAPATRNPAAAAVALKSNILQYGPWYAAGAPGKVKFDQDQSLTPWLYGGFATMDLAGNARVAEAITSMQVSEAGSLELAGAPTVSLGDVLQAGGPNVTNIDVNIGTNGVTTTYRFQTFTPRYGVFNKGTSERLKRLALSGQQLRRTLRTLVRRDIANATAIGNAARTAQAFAERLPRSVRRESPSDILVAYASKTDDGGDVRVSVSTTTTHEALTMMNAGSGQPYTATAAMSISGLIRPFSTCPGSGTHMSSYTTPSIGFGLTCRDLDPWKGQNDIEFYMYGNSYDGFHAYRRNGEYGNARPIALRGPVVISGWGYDLTGSPVPAENGSFTQNYLKRSDLWKTGPLDCLWDNQRGVWTCHGTVRGITLTGINSPGQFLPGTGTMTVVYKNTNVPEPHSNAYSMTVYNQFSSAIPTGTLIMASYIALENKWFVVAADCSD